MPNHIIQNSPAHVNQQECVKGWMVLVCEDCKSIERVAIHCWKRTCPVCSKKRMLVMRKNLLKLVEGWKWVALITLTIQNAEIETEKIHSKIINLKKAFRRLCQMKAWKQSVKSGVGFIELKHTKRDKIHAHIHMLVDCEWLEVSKLSAMWKRATRGEGYIVDIRRVSDVKGGVNEISKYVLKLALYREDVKNIIEKAITRINLIVKYKIDNASLLDINNIEKIGDEETFMKCPGCGKERDWLRNKWGRIKIFKEEPALDDVKEYLGWDFW